MKPHILKYSPMNTALYKSLAKGDVAFDTPEEIAATLKAAFNMNTPSYKKMSQSDREANRFIDTMIRTAENMEFRPPEAPAPQTDFFKVTLNGPEPVTIPIPRTSMSYKDIQSLFGLDLPDPYTISETFLTLRDALFIIFSRVMGYQIIPSLLMANMVLILWPRESGLNWFAVSKDGDARGIGQWRVSTWNGLEAKSKILQSKIMKISSVKNLLSRLNMGSNANLSHGNAEELAIWARGGYNTIMMEKKHLKGITPLQNAIAKMHPLQQLVRAALMIEASVNGADKWWAWSDEKWMWLPTKRNTAVEFFAIFPPAMYDFVAGYYLIHKIPYGDGIAFMNKDWLMNNKANAEVESPKFLNHVYFPKGTDRYALAAKDALAYYASPQLMTIYPY